MVCTLGSQGNSNQQKNVEIVDGVYVCMYIICTSKVAQNEYFVILYSLTIRAVRSALYSSV